MAENVNTYDCFYDRKLAILRDKKTLAEVSVPALIMIKIEEAVEKEKSNIMGLCTAAYSGAIVVTGEGTSGGRMLRNVTWKLKRHNAADSISKLRNIFR